MGAATGGEAVTAPQGANLTGLVDGMGVVAWEVDAGERRFTFVSRYAETLLGYPPERWSDDLDTLAELIHPADRAEVLHDDTGVPLRVRGMLADVTRRRIAEQRNRFLEALEQRLRGWTTPSRSWWPPPGCCGSTWAPTGARSPWPRLTRTTS
ncbi:PAS domain-containing protein [Actinosynnema sp. CA-299493]